MLFSRQELALKLAGRAPVVGLAEHLGRLAPCPPSAVFVCVLAGGFCTQPPPFTYAIRPKCSAGLVVIGGFLSWGVLGVLVASEFKINRLQAKYIVRKKLQIYEQTANCKLHATPRIPPSAPRPTMPIRQY